MLGDRNYIDLPKNLKSTLALPEELLSCMRRPPMDGSDVATPPLAPNTPKALMPASSFLSILLGLRPLLKFYETFPEGLSACEFSELALKVLGIQTINEGVNLTDIPSQGPALFFANHPFGGIEGVIMAAKLGALRPDFKLFANEMLARIPELSPMIIPINVAAKSQKENLAGIRAALKHVQDGGALGLFPSGVVAHWQLSSMQIVETAWYSLCGRLGKIPNLTAIPVFFKGTNSALFHAAGCIHSMLRTFLLPRELWGMRGKTIRYSLGKPIDSGVLTSLCDDKARTAHMRARCEQMGKADKGLPTIWPVPVAHAGDQQALRNEVHTLLENDTLASEERYAVFAITGTQSPRIINEIGRLREETFRLVGEGSGKDRDLDHYDPSYTHLVLWDTEKDSMAGAYRVRCFMPNEAEECKEKLYTSSLFHYKPEFFHKCHAAMELGRAFVVPEYQRDYVPLLMLWKGIGRIIVRHNLRTLFGPCSIGLGYAEASTHILRQYLKENHWSDELSILAKGICEPAPISGLNPINVHGLDYKACNKAVKDIENGEKGLPILFKHYLQLGGEIAAFHEDKAFGTLDALLVVDLVNTPKKILLRYMTEQEVQELRASYSYDENSATPTSLP